MTMEIEIILGCIVLVALILIVIANYHNKFIFAVVKIDEAENNIDIYLQKKLDLLNRARPIIKKELKLEEFLEDLENIGTQDINHFEKNEKLKKAYDELFKLLDENEKLYKSESLMAVIDEINDNEEDLVAAVKFYNDTVVVYNKLVKSFPSNIIRLFYHYKEKEYYNNEKREIYEILKDDNN
jgi:LemA protein